MPCRWWAPLEEDGHSLSVVERGGTAVPAEPRSRGSRPSGLLSRAQRPFVPLEWKTTLITVPFSEAVTSVIPLASKAGAAQGCGERGSCLRLWGGGGETAPLRPPRPWTAPRRPLSLSLTVHPGLQGWAALSPVVSRTFTWILGLSRGSSAPRASTRWPQGQGVSEELWLQISVPKWQPSSFLGALRLGGGPRLLEDGLSTVHTSSVSASKEATATSCSSCRFRCRPVPAEVGEGSWRRARAGWSAPRAPGCAGAPLGAWRGRGGLCPGSARGPPAAPVAATRCRGTHRRLIPAPCFNVLGFTSGNDPF